MEQLFIEINNINIRDKDKSKNLIDYKQEIINLLKIEKNKIDLELNNNLRNTLLYLNIWCLHEIGGSIFDIQNNGLELFEKKNKDYGESYKECGVIGILVRIIDKINRLENLNYISNYKINESRKDTLIDLHNYTLLGIMCIDN